MPRHLVAAQLDLLGRLVPSSCGVVARRAKPQARRAKSEAESGLPQPKIGKRAAKSKKYDLPAVEKMRPENQLAVTRVIMAGISVSGLAAMIYQVDWTRVITLSIGSSVYAFSLIVTAFICGLAIGSLIIARLIDRRKNLIFGLAAVQGAIGISALVIVPLLGRLPLFFAESLFTASHSFQSLHMLEFVVIFALIVVPTLMMGAAVPMAVKICTPSARQVARFFGNVYAVNTLGAIAGSVMAGFCLIPWLGTQNSILVAVALNNAAAVALFLHAPRVSVPRRIAAALLSAGTTALVWFPLPQWNTAFLTSAPYLYADEYQSTSAQKGIDLGSAIEAGRQLLYFKEGLQALVSVEKTIYGDVVLGVNGKIDASAKGADTATQLMLGHLPLLLHPDAGDVLVIGLGSGMTLSAVEKHPVKALDVVEIEAAVVEAS